MKNLTLLLILLTAFQGAVFSQSCLPEGITFETQAQVDSFQVNFPNCTRIEGEVTIGSLDGTDITNLEGLSNIISIGGYLYIWYNANLHHLTGLNNLNSIGEYLEIYSNDSLLNLTGLENLDSVNGSVWIWGNQLLTNLAELSGLSYINEDLVIQFNYNLNSLNGLESLTAIKKDLIVNANRSLTDLYGLSSIDSVGGDFLIGTNNVLPDLSGLEALSVVSGNLTIQSNGTITNLIGLAGLAYVGKSVFIESNHSLIDLSGMGINSIGESLYISWNPLLTSLQGGESLQSIADALHINQNNKLSTLEHLYGLTFLNAVVIEGNDTLESLAGLENVNAGTMTWLKIFNNQNLSSCAVKSICDYLASPDGYVKIEDNAPGCNNREEVELACSTISVNEWDYLNTISIYPNPSSTEFTINISGSSSEFQLSIFNLNGEEVFRQQITETSSVIDISQLQQGIYFVKLTSEDTVAVLKMVKE